ncbi:MAG: PAS domain-containing protein [Archangiaceae bacterium]|nr:PAS domain-containing protein [Archangiaceae bacterium]
MHLPQRTTRSLTLMVAAIVAVAAVSLWSQRRSDVARERTAHSLSVLLTLEGVSALVKDVERNQRGYLLTDQPAYHQGYLNAAHDLTPKLLQLEELTREDPVQYARVGELVELTAQKMETLARSLSTRVVPGPDQTTSALEQKLTAARTHEELGFNSHFRRDRNASTQSAAAVVAGAGLLLAFAILASLSVRKDFLARSAAEAEAARQQARYTSLIDATCEVVWSTRPDGHMSGEQKVWCRYTGQSVEDCQADGWLAAVHPDDVDSTWRAFKNAIAQGKGFSLEHRVRRADGEYRHFEVHVEQVKEQDGTVREWVGVHSDVTEQRLNESERERLIARLGRINAELDQFAYVASHDLKAPLRGISSLSQWLEQDLGERLTGTDKEHLRLLRSRADRLEALIDGILQYSRAGRQRQRVEQVDSERLIGETVELLAPPKEARVEKATPLPTLRTEKVPFQQVVMNLIANAFKYTRRNDPVVQLSAKDAGRFWEFEVKDNGPGIPPEHQQRIWQIFQTLESKDCGAGTGIGLSVVKKIVEGKGGRAWVESVLGQGATFHFTWPKQEA